MTTGKAPIPKLKLWTRKELKHRENFDFSWAAEWPIGGEHGLTTAWLWELDRELGSGNPPFFAGWEIARSKKWRQLVSANRDMPA